MIRMTSLLTWPEVVHENKRWVTRDLHSATSGHNRESKRRPKTVDSRILRHKDHAFPRAPEQAALNGATKRPQDLAVRISPEESTSHVMTSSLQVRRSQVPAAVCDQSAQQCRLHRRLFLDAVEKALQRDQDHSESRTAVSVGSATHPPRELKKQELGSNVRGSHRNADTDFTDEPTHPRSMGTNSSISGFSRANSSVSSGQTVSSYAGSLRAHRSAPARPQIESHQNKFRGLTQHRSERLDFRAHQQKISSTFRILPRDLDKLNNSRKCSVHSTQYSGFKFVPVDRTCNPTQENDEPCFSRNMLEGFPYRTSTAKPRVDPTIYIQNVVLDDDTSLSEEEKDPSTCTEQGVTETAHLKPTLAPDKFRAPAKWNKLQNAAKKQTTLSPADQSTDIRSEAPIRHILLGITGYSFAAVLLRSSARVTETESAQQHHTTTKLLTCHFVTSVFAHFSHSSGPGVTVISVPRNFHQEQQPTKCFVSVSSTSYSFFLLGSGLSLETNPGAAADSNGPRRCV